MLHDDEFMMALECEPIELADPEVRASIKEISRELEAAGVSPMSHVYARSGAVVATVPSLGPYLLGAALIVLPALTKIIVAWVQAAPGRKVRVKIGDTQIEANSVEDVERLISAINELQTKASRKKPSG